MAILLTGFQGSMLKTALIWSARKYAATGRLPMQLCIGASNRNFSTSPTSPSSKGEYKYISDPDPSLKWGDITERAANVIFFTELIRGVHCPRQIYISWVCA